LSHVYYVKDGVRYFIAVRRMGISLLLLISYKVSISLILPVSLSALLCIKCHADCKPFSLCGPLTEGLLPQSREKVGNPHEIIWPGDLL